MILLKNAILVNFEYFYFVPQLPIMLIRLLDAPEQQFSHQEIEEDVRRLPRAPPNPRLSSLQTAKHDVSPQTPVSCIRHLVIVQLIFLF